MSDTPRSDKAEDEAKERYERFREVDWPAFGDVGFDFARQLERENNELRASNDRMFKINEGLMAENVELADALRGMLDRYAPTHSALCFTLRTNGTSAPCCCDNAEQVARETLARYADHKK